MISDVAPRSRSAELDSEHQAAEWLTVPDALGRFAWAMTRTTGSNGLTCGVPIADLEVNWDEDRSRQMFEHIINDDTEGIPEGLCTPTGLEE